MKPNSKTLPTCLCNSRALLILFPKAQLPSLRYFLLQHLALPLLSLFPAWHLNFSAPWDCITFLSCTIKILFRKFKKFSSESILLKNLVEYFWDIWRLNRLTVNSHFVLFEFNLMIARVPTLLVEKSGVHATFFPALLAFLGVSNVDIPEREAWTAVPSGMSFFLGFRFPFSLFPLRLESHTCCCLLCHHSPCSATAGVFIPLLVEGVFSLLFFSTL